MTVSEFLNKPIVVAMFMATVSFLMMFMSWWLNRKTAIHDKLEKALSTKVDREDCIPAMGRVGKQVDGHASCIRDLEIGMGWVVGAMGGNYDQIKKNGGSHG